jgi:hypothetical protein
MLEITLCYVGPGLDGGVVAAVLGILASFFLALFAIIWYPLKRVYLRLKNKRYENQIAKIQ